ncbi:MAG: hypothetical protein HY000_32055 [Planctomycetes bacterium]|nr:hypothetical protein [Planctomycetota bacterium]
MPDSSSAAENRSRSGPIAALVLIGLLVLYALSEGPALYLYVRGWAPGEIVLSVTRRWS